jgi:hypothetical protein
MRASTAGLLAAVALFAASTSVQAQDVLFNASQLVQPAPGSGSQAQPFGPSRRPQQKPLFPLPDPPRGVSALALACGRVIPATPEIDPKILKTVPDDGMAYTMRKVPAPPCVAPNAPPPVATPPDAR